MAPSHGNCQLHANTGERFFRKFMPEIQLHARSMRLPRHLSEPARAHCARRVVYTLVARKSALSFVHRDGVPRRSKEPREQN
jgi:hypothetical protein